MHVIFRTGLDFPSDWNVVRIRKDRVPNDATTRLPRYKLGPCSFRFHACSSLRPGLSMPGNVSHLSGTPPESLLSAFSMPMHRNPALSRDQIGMVVVLDLLLSLMHLWEGDLGIHPSSSCLWFYSKSG